MNPKWYENFFQGIALEMWRKAVSPEQTRLEVDFLQRTLRLQTGSRVLDVPCGLGGSARMLANNFGCIVTVLDIMQEYCRVGEMLTRLTGFQVRNLNENRIAVVQAVFERA